MRQKIIGGNWKMHGTQHEVSTLIDGIIQELNEKPKATVIVFPGFVHLTQAHGLLEKSGIKLGAQNINQHDEGAFTGEISGRMLQDIGCEYVLVGHSERRQLFSETNKIVAEKFSAVIRHGLTPVFCVGETLKERETNQTEKVILDQINTVIARAGLNDFQKCIIAYEPVWAIGTGLTATPEQAQKVHAFIRESLALGNEELAENISIIYGGSVKGSNAKEIFAMPDVDGGLIGGASLKPDDFVSIIKSI